MSPRLRVWGAYRALAVSARPVAAKPAPFLYTVRVPRSRPYSDDTKSQTPKSSESLSKPEPSGSDAGGTQPASVPESGDNVAQEIIEEYTEDSVAMVWNLLQTCQTCIGTTSHLFV